MKRFTFRLERLLGLRHSAESESARVLGERSRAADEAQQRTAAGAAREREAVAQAANARSRPRPAGLITTLDASVERLADERVRRVAAQAEADASREAARLAYQAARTDRRVLERLKEVRHSDWTIDSGREEQKTMDEVAGRLRPNFEGPIP